MKTVRSPAFSRNRNTQIHSVTPDACGLKAGLRTDSPRRKNVDRPNQRAPINRQNRGYDRTIQSGSGADDADRRAARNRRLRRADRRIYEPPAMAHRSHVMVFRDAASDLPPGLSRI